VRELIDDGRTGWVVRPEDPDALARAMAAIEGSSEAERTAMGAAGRERTAARWGLSAVVDRWEQLYEDALATS
jgi:glycosyltransferase involved in cell wall biosynthesis